MSRALQRPEPEIEVGVEELRQPLRLRLSTLLHRATEVREGLDGHRQATAL